VSAHADRRSANFQALSRTANDAWSMHQSKALIAHPKAPGSLFATLDPVKIYNVRVKEEFNGQHGIVVWRTADDARGRQKYYVYISRYKLKHSVRTQPTTQDTLPRPSSILTADSISPETCEWG
jgi:hypothetical protein